jgi:hypothetical protein
MSCAAPMGCNPTVDLLTSLIPVLADGYCKVPLLNSN